MMGLYERIKEVANRKGYMYSTTFWWKNVVN